MCIMYCIERYRRYKKNQVDIVDEYIYEGYPVRIHDRIKHVSDDVCGTVISIDCNLPHPTTCCVIWDDDPYQIPDIQWTNKLIPINLI